MFEDLPKNKKIALTVLLLLPLFASIIWLLYIKFTSLAPGFGEGSLLSPVDTKPLIISLIIFTTGYLFFIGLMFSRNIQEAIEDLTRSMRR